MRFSTRAPDLRSTLKGEEVLIAKGTTAGMRLVTEGLKNALRQDILDAGFTNNYLYRPGKNRLANTWRGKTYPEGRDSLDAVAYVYSNAAKIIDAFDRGATIRANGKKFLAIPTPDAGVRQVSVSRGSKRLTPSDWQRETGVKLRFVPSKTGGVLVADAFYRRQAARFQRRKSFRPIRDSGPDKGRSFVVIFVLVKQVKLRKRLDIDAIAEEWADRVPGLIAGEG